MKWSKWIFNEVHMLLRGKCKPTDTCMYLCVCVCYVCVWYFCSWNEFLFTYLIPFNPYPKVQSDYFGKQEWDIILLFSKIYSKVHFAFLHVSSADLGKISRVAHMADFFPIFREYSIVLIESTEVTRDIPF